MPLNFLPLYNSTGVASTQVQCLQLQLPTAILTNTLTNSCFNTYVFFLKNDILYICPVAIITTSSHAIHYWIAWLALVILYDKYIRIKKVLLLNFNCNRTDIKNMIFKKKDSCFFLILWLNKSMVLNYKTVDWIFSTLNHQIEEYEPS